MENPVTLLVKKALNTDRPRYETIKVNCLAVSGAPLLLRLYLEGSNAF